MGENYFKVTLSFNIINEAMIIKAKKTKKNGLTKLKQTVYFILSTM